MANLTVHGQIDHKVLAADIRTYHYMSSTHLLAALVTRTLDKVTLQAIALDLAQLAFELYPTESEESKKKRCTEQLTAILTHFNNAQEVLGIIADLPLSARVEKWTIRKLVEYAFLKQQEDEPKLTLAPVPQSPTLTQDDADTTGKAEEE